MEVEQAIVAAAGGDAALDFDGWARRVFAHQFERVAPYRTLCERRGRTPATVTSWRDVPPVPTAAFRHVDLATGPAEVVFRTSGTSSGAEARGRHLVPRLSLYRSAAVPTFARYLLPDGARPHFVFLLPPPALRPDSSLVQMCAWVGDAYGASSAWGADENGLDVPALTDRLAAFERSGEAVLIAGPTAGFAHLFDTGLTVRLGPGSRLMDTGGAKGTSRPLSRAGFRRRCWSQLGVPGYFCVNEYGMTELCSQRYESALADRFAGRSLDHRRLVAPPWLRTRIVDPDTLDDVPAGRTGLLCHHDLANAGSVAVVVTEALGHTEGDDGITVTGRVAGAVARGCGQLLADVTSCA
jgi:hypothetical protein